MLGRAQLGLGRRDLGGAARRIRGNAGSELPLRDLYHGDGKEIGPFVGGAWCGAVPEYTLALALQVFGRHKAVQEELFALVSDLSKRTFQLLSASDDSIVQNPETVLDLYR